MPSYGHSGSAQDAVVAFGNRDVFGPFDVPLAPSYFGGGVRAWGIGPHLNSSR